MPIKGALVVLILTALAMRTCTTIKRSCAPLGFREFETFMTYLNAEDTGLTWMYMLYSPPRPKKLSLCQTLLKTRSLLLILLAIGCVETNPGEFYR